MTSVKVPCTVLYTYTYTDIEEFFYAQHSTFHDKSVISFHFYGRRNFHIDCQSICIFWVYSIHDKWPINVREFRIQRLPPNSII
jgi:hypothetical protein